MNEDVFRKISIADSIQVPEGGRQWTKEQTLARRMAGAVDSSNWKMEMYQDQIRGFREEIARVQQQAEKFDNWWGRSTGQHRTALQSLLATEHSASLSIKHWEDQKRQETERIAEVIQGFATHGLNVPEHILDDIDSTNGTYTELKGAEDDAETFLNGIVRNQGEDGNERNKPEI